MQKTNEGQVLSKLDRFVDSGILGSSGRMKILKWSHTSFTEIHLKKASSAHSPKFAGDPFYYWEMSQNG